MIILTVFAFALIAALFLPLIDLTVFSVSSTFSLFPSSKPSRSATILMERPFGRLCNDTLAWFVLCGVRMAPGTVKPTDGVDKNVMRVIPLNFILEKMIDANILLLLSLYCMMCISGGYWTIHSLLFNEWCFAKFWAHAKKWVYVRYYYWHDVSTGTTYDVQSLCAKNY